MEEQEWGLGKIIEGAMAFEEPVVYLVQAFKKAPQL